jgi:hypothetical protein
LLSQLVALARCGVAVASRRLAIPRGRLTVEHRSHAVACGPPPSTPGRIRLFTTTLLAPGESVAHCRV